MSSPITTVVTPFSQAQIRDLIPHAGSMCLLDQVLNWNATQIECVATSHCALDNPLRHNGILPIHAGIEYCAQAIATHGGLTKSDADAPPRRGYLAIISNTEWNVQRLDDCAGTLHITAKRQVALQQGAQYVFAIHHEGHTLLTGQAVVALD